MLYKKVIVFGRGRIGSELVRLLQSAEGLEEINILSRSDWSIGGRANGKWIWGRANAREPELPKCFGDTAVFIATSTKDDGLAARDLILHYALRGATVATCEKGALSNYFADLEDVLEFPFHHVYFSAALGGMAQIVPFVLSRIPPPSMHMRAVLNSSLSVLFGWHKSSPSLRSYEDQFQDAYDYLVRNSWAEPPNPEDASPDLACAIHEEIEDAARKAIMLANFCYLRKGDISVKRKRVTVKRLGMHDLVTQRDKGNRFVVEYCSGDEIEGTERAHFTRVLFRFMVGGVRCRGGFVHASELECFQLPTEDEYCAVSIRDPRFRLPQVIMASGAGVTETALTMLNDVGIDVTES